MALYTFIYDSATQRKRVVAYPGFLDTVVQNSGTGATNYTIVGVTIDALHVLDVFVDGRLQTENVHYTRSVAQNRVQLSAAAGAYSEVKIRVYLK